MKSFEETGLGHVPLTDKIFGDGKNRSAAERISHIWRLL